MNPAKATCAGHTSGREFSLSSLVVVVLIGVHMVTTAWAAETGIRGTVLWGPIKPGPASPGQVDEAPLRATFNVYSGDRETARFQSAADGSFDVALPAGSYTIVPDKKTPVPYAQAQKTEVTVPEDGYAVVTIRLDTGMR